MEESLIRYRINQITDTGINVTLALVEDVELETVSQQQLILDAIDSTVTDKEVKQQIKPILEAILRAQPQTVIKSYPQTKSKLTIVKHC
ncbi:MAG: hypothetical protein K0S67_2046 [Nitrososphaeraceae archaeon]|nr:hypothetical protein [Nitrososphaeraceae archaeon]